MIGALGMFLLAGWGRTRTTWTVVRNMVLIGLGLGPAMPGFTLAAQTAVRTDQIGVVTSLTQFSRAIGAHARHGDLWRLARQSLRAGAFQALPPQVASLPPAVVAQVQNPQALLNPQAADAIRAVLVQLPQGAQMYDALIGAIRVALASSLHYVFLASACIAVLGVINALFMHEMPLRSARTTTRPTAAARIPTVEEIESAAAMGTLPPLAPDYEPALDKKGPDRAA